MTCRTSCAGSIRASAPVVLRCIEAPPFRIILIKVGDETATKLSKEACKMIEVGEKPNVLNKDKS